MKREGDRMNLLVVDDEYYIVKGIVGAINRKDLGIQEIFTAYSAAQARNIFVKNPVNIMLTDIEMPHGDGLSLINWVHENNYHTISIILTGHQRFDYAQKAIKMHCYDYILKPVDTGRLNVILKSAIENLDMANGSNGIIDKINTVSENQEADFVSRARDYLNENLSSPELSRDAFASFMHMNPDYLSATFHKKYGLTISNYVLNMRIDKAKELLLYTSMSISEIGEQVGFSSNSYFCKQFRKATSVTPQMFREKNNT